MGKKSNGIGTRDGRSVTGIGCSGHEFLKTIIDGKNIEVSSSIYCKPVRELETDQYVCKQNWPIRMRFSISHILRGVTV